MELGSGLVAVTCDCLDCSNLVADFGLAIYRSCLVLRAIQSGFFWCIGGYRNYDRAFILRLVGLAAMAEVEILTMVEEVSSSRAGLSANVS